MLLAVGRVLRPHGIRGEVAVEVRTDDPDLRFAPGTVLQTDPAEAGPVAVSAARWHSGRLLVSFTGIADRGQADLLRGALLLVDSADLPDPADPAEFRDHQLIGLAAVTTAGEHVGTVTDVLHYGQDLLVVAGSGRRGGTDILVPFVAALVPAVDIPAGHVLINPPPGLLDPDAAG